MAVRSFATNNLVEDHDMYVKFMKIRWNHLSKEGGKNTDILFYKKGLVVEAFGIKYSKEHYKDVISQITKSTRIIKLWHSITIAYNLWCEYSKFYIDKDHSRIMYKQFVDIPEDVLKKFKFRFEQTVKNAGCEYKGNGASHLIDPCRLLAMFWTYLDLVKDTKTQRYFPNNATIERAAKVFGYKKGDNPFKMNGIFTKRCVRDKKESVIDIAEQAAKEVEEERKIDPILIISKAKDEYDELIEIKEKYEALLKTTQEQADNYYKLLKEKMDLENYNSRLRDENNNLRDEYAGIKARLENESSNTDIIAILSHVVDIMKKHGITKLETGIDGYSIDIIQKFVITGRS